MDRKLMKMLLGVFLVTIFSLYGQTTFAGGFYLPEIATPGSVGTAGVANVTNVDDASSAYTNPAGMTYLKKDEVQAEMEVLIPPLINSTLISPQLAVMKAAMPACLLSSPVSLL